MAGTVLVELQREPKVFSIIPDLYVVTDALYIEGGPDVLPAAALGLGVAIGGVAGAGGGVWVLGASCVAAMARGIARSAGIMSIVRMDFEPDGENVHTKQACHQRTETRHERSANS